MTANCQLDLRDYPLDEQSCNLTLLSYAYPLQQVDYFWKATDKQGIVILADEMNEYTLTDIKTKKGLVHYGTRSSSSDFTHLWAVFIFERRLGYSFIQIYAPTVLIVILSWLSFWLSKDAIPARVALGVTTVLTIVTLMGSFRSSVPKVSYIKALDVFFIISFFFVFGAVLEYVVVILHHEKKLKEEKKKDRAEKKIEDRAEVEMVPLRQDDGAETSGMDTKHHDDDDKQAVPKEEFERSHSSNLGGLRKTKELVKFAFLESNASIVDRVSRILFPVTYLAFNIFYWSYYSIFKFNGV